MVTKQGPVLRLRAFGSCGEGRIDGFDAMEAVSWELGEEPITDSPDPCDPMLTHLVHHVNDTYCEHMASIGSADWLCVRCSATVLDLAHRTIDTVLSGRTRLDRSRIHVRVALEQAAATTDALGATTYTDQGLDLVGRWVVDPSAVEVEALSELVDGRPLSGLATERIVGDLAAAAASAASRNCARLAGRSVVAAVETRRPHQEFADYHRVIDHFTSLSHTAETVGPERQVVWLR